MCENLCVLARLPISCQDFCQEKRDERGKSGVYLGGGWPPNVCAHFLIGPVLFDGFEVVDQFLRRCRMWVGVKRQGGGMEGKGGVAGGSLERTNVGMASRMV